MVGSIDLWYHFADLGEQSGPAWIAQWKINWVRNENGDMSYTISGMEGDDVGGVTAQVGYNGPQGKTYSEGDYPPNELRTTSAGTVEVDPEAYPAP